MTTPDTLTPAEASRPVDTLAHAQVWGQITRHIDGLAVGSTVRALHARGALPELTGGRPVEVAALADRLDANPGYLHVALRLLADQGWLTPAPDGTSYTATALGARFLTDLAPYYTLTEPLAALATRLPALLAGVRDREGESELVRVRDLMRSEWGIPRDVRPIRARVTALAHLDGHLAAPLVTELLRGGGLLPGGGGPSVALGGGGSSVALGAGGGGPSLALGVDGDEGRMSLSLRARGGEGAPVQRAVLDVLAHLGWVVVGSGGARLTPHGTVAASYARQYWHPVSYLPTFAAVPRLLFGSLETPHDEDAHLDRDLDITFSGEVYSATCQDAFLDLVLPLLSTGSPPAAVVDSGCGDGTLLHSLATALPPRTPTPLLVGAEPSPVARRATAARLAATGVPHLVVDADITDPGTVASALTAHGVDPADALHVSKSVVHDRDYRPPEHPADAGPPPSARFYATPDGRAVPPHDLARNLVDHFRRWEPLTRRHGMVVIEAHAADPATAARLVGRTLATSFDATHGYSRQLPVEPHVFAWAARTAGLVSVAHRDLGDQAIGHTMLTIDHFVGQGR
ncbi:hypothetical protein ABZ307_06015 [Streptomyces griseorubiginosus]|uniref:AprA-related methyltransferase n=1 Tax=Streptomyces griseorubiginosus TaxID=67304 RepID=UPI0033AFEE92